MIAMRGSTVQNSAAMDSQVINGTDKDMETVYSVRGGILFTQAAIVLFAGLLLPIPPVAIDVLLAVNLVFTTMLLFVVLVAREPADITSVPPVVIFVTLLRLGTNVAAAKSIILIANGGHILDWCGTRIYYGFISIVIAVLLVFLICVLICKAATFIRQKAIGYLAEIIPGRQATLQTEFQAGTLTYNQMLHAKNRIEKQIKFFAGMASVSSLLLCDGVIAFIITLATIFGATALGILHASAITDGTQIFSPLALAIALTTAVPAAFVALALRLLIKKRFLLVLKVQSPAPHAIHVENRPMKSQSLEYDIPVAIAVSDPIIETVEEEPLTTAAPGGGESGEEEIQNSDNTELAQESELLQEDTLDKTTGAIASEQTWLEDYEIVKPLPNELPDSPVNEIMDVDIDKAYTEQENTEFPPAEQQSALSQIAPDGYEASSVQEEVHLSLEETEPSAIAQFFAPPPIVRDDYYYDSILATIGDKQKATILLAGESIAQLPVTIAVELVIRIIQLNKRCLLIDMDPSRNAIAIAFDVDSTSMQGKAVPTGIKNLWISPADNPDSPVAIKLSRKVTNALRVFDYVVIYAPNATTDNVQHQLAGIPDVVIIFGTHSEAVPLEQFSKTLILWGCRTVFEQEFLKKNT
jgi:hypothetical protein